MINYNIIIIDNKVNNSYLNLNKTEFLNKLWEWCYVDDLWDEIYAMDYLSDEEGLNEYLLNMFIPEDFFHSYFDDDLECFAFTASDENLEVKEFDDDEMLLEFIINKIKEHYK